MNIKLTLTHIAIILTCAGFLMSCGTSSQFTPGAGSKYQYNYRLVYPVENSNMLFQDDSIIIQFKFDEAAIRFQLQNISTSNLSIDWNSASINVNGRHMAVRHSSNLYEDTLQSQSILIQPLGFIRDIVIPRDNIYNNGDKWIEIDLLPTTDNNSPALKESINKSVGSRIGLLMPINFGTTTKNYEFDFVVDSVSRIPWKDYAPLKRNPPPPSPKKSILGLDNVTTAILVVGVLGFSAYILSIKKNPPTE